MSLLNITDLTNVNELINLDIKPLQHFRYFLFLKDLKGKYLNCNHNLAIESGFHHKNDVLGLTDFDFPYIAEDEALFFRKKDQEAIKKESLISCIEPITLPNDRKYFAFTQKYPLRPHKKTIGSIGFSLLMEKNDNTILPSEVYQEEPEDKPLTERQLDCLFYLVKGMTYKQVAEKLALSPRTVESYLYIIKEKLNCEDRASLVAKALILPIIRKKLLIAP